MQRKRAVLVEQAPVLPLYFLCVYRVALPEFSDIFFFSKSWLMVNGLCFVALPYPNSNFMINDLAIRSRYIEANSKCHIVVTNVSKFCAIVKKNR